MTTKRKFNLYCILLLAAVVFSLFTAAQKFVAGFSQGWNDATIEVQRSAGAANYEAYELTLQANDPRRCELALTNTATGKTDSLRVSQAMVWVATSQRPTESLPVIVGKMVLIALVPLCFIAFWVVFIRLVWAVNRGEDFGTSTTRRLRLMGWLLIGLYASEWIFHLITLPPAISYEGYRVSSPADTDPMLLVSGIGLLVVGQLFAVAQRMKEENELTI